MSRGGAVAWLLALCLAATGARADEPHASDDDLAIAKAHFNTGQAYYEHGRFADAAHEFEEAFRLSGRPALLYNMGKSYDGGNDFARALGAYRKFLAAAPADNADRDFATQRIQRLGALVGTIRLDGAREGSSVLVDGAAVGTTPLPPLEVNPGRHAVEVTLDQFATLRRAVDVPVGGTAVVAVQQVEAVKVVTVAAPAPHDQPIWQRWWLWTAIGGAVVVAGAVTAIVLTRSDDTPPGIRLPMVQ
jgi:tetratricopeptide (TPR) repeat protein